MRGILDSILGRQNGKAVKRHGVRARGRELLLLEYRELVGRGRECKRERRALRRRLCAQGYA